MAKTALWLKASPIDVTKMVKNRFARMLGYLYDIIVSKDPETHLKTLHTVLQRLQKAGLKLKPSMCEFLQERSKYFGHEVGEGIHNSDDRITAVKNFPKPQSVDNLRSILGQAGSYRPFIHNFAAKASPLTRLLRK